MKSERTSTIAISTSTRPAQKVRSFCKEMARALPHTIILTRGKSSFRDLAHDAFTKGVSRLIVVDSRENNPSALKIYRLEPGCLEEIIKIRIIENQLKRERKIAQRVKKASAITFEFYKVENWLQEKLLDSFRPILTLSKTNLETTHTFFVGIENSMTAKVYTGKIIDPLTDMIVSPSFKFVLERRNVNG
jgi:rRNA maturation protein Rpf1